MIWKLALTVSCLTALASMGSLLVFAEPAHDGSQYQTVEPPYKGTNPDMTGAVNQVRSLMAQTLNAMKGLSLNRAESACDGVNRKPGSTANGACIQKYLQVYQNPVVDMRLIFGYKDDGISEHTNDVNMLNMLVDMITSPCPHPANGIFACEFRRDKDDAEIFYKEVTDPRGEKRLVKLTLASSSYTSNNDLNRKEFKKEQKQQSAHAQKLFLDGLKHADVVLYNGHSRDGGGPDFSPAVTYRSGKTNYQWYRAHRGGLKRMTDALRSSKDHTPPVIGMISCQSKALFYQALKKAAPNSGFIMTHGFTWWQDEPSTIFGTLNGLLGQVCDPDFTKIMNLNPHIDSQSRLYTERLF